MLGSAWSSDCASAAAACREFVNAAALREQMLHSTMVPDQICYGNVGSSRTATASVGF